MVAAGNPSYYIDHSGKLVVVVYTGQTKHSSPTIFHQEEALSPQLHHDKNFLDAVVYTARAGSLHELAEVVQAAALRMGYLLTVRLEVAAATEGVGVEARQMEKVPFLPVY